MPDILISKTLAANQRYRPFAESEKNWRFRKCPYPRGLYTILVRTTGADLNVEHSVLIGTTEVVQQSDTSVGGTAGVMPVPDTTPAHQFFAEYGDEIDLLIVETAAATPTVQIWANVEPA
ncbi:MAG TPA: hypothetical protein VI700_01315 [Thermoanaerobaculaceae bacterium]|nr:hypothetical protein [Thermoanaerobaculaceae bacterium]